MNKVLVKLIVPSIEKDYDIWIPINKSIYNIINLLVSAIYEFTDGNYNPEKMPNLYDKKTARMYNINQTVVETTIRNGTELILI